MTWLPTEHGGYAMLLFPLASALALPGAGPRAWALALLIVSIFLLHRVLLRACGAAWLAGVARTRPVGQLIASVTLASLSVPVALAAGGSPVIAVTLACVWAGEFAIAARLVHAVPRRRVRILGWCFVAVCTLTLAQIVSLW